MKLSIKEQIKRMPKMFYMMLKTTSPLLIWTVFGIKLLPSPLNYILGCTIMIACLYWAVDMFKILYKVYKEAKDEKT